MIEVFDHPQGSPEWHEVRRGIPTASMFGAILAGGEGRTTYLYKLAGERMTGELAEGFVNEHMERGKVMEAEARHWYAFTRDVEPTQVGFVRNGKTGASPDSLIGDNRALEIKTTLPHLLIPMVKAQKKNPHYYPPKFYPQCQGVLLATERDVCDLVVYWPKMPKLVCEIRRDEPYIQTLRDVIDVFDLELRRLVTELKAM